MEKKKDKTGKDNGHPYSHLKWPAIIIVILIILLVILMNHFYRTGKI